MYCYCGIFQIFKNVALKFVCVIFLFGLVDRYRGAYTALRSFGRASAQSAGH